MNSFPIEKPSNVALLTSYLDDSGLSQIHQQLLADKATLTLPLITIYPAACDIAMSGVDLALDGLARSVEPVVDGEKLSAVFHVWKHMLDLNISVPSSALRGACHALVKTDKSVLDTATFFLEHLYDPCERASVTYYYYLYIADLLLAFKMDPVFIDLVLKKWVLKDSVAVTTARSACMHDCLTSGGKSWLVSRADQLYDTYRAAAVRFFDELSLCCHKDTSLIVEHLDRSVLGTVLHYELDPACIKLLNILRCAPLPPAVLFKVIERVHNAYKFTSLDGQEDTAATQAWVDLKLLLPQLNHWNIALMGICDAVSALSADPSEERCMAALRTWKLLLDWDVPVANSISLVQTTASLLVTTFDRGVVDAALLFITHLYTPVDAWIYRDPANFHLHKLLSYHNMHPALIHAFLDKWRACTDIALIKIKCACLYHSLFLTFEKRDDGADATFAANDNSSHHNYTLAYPLIVEEMLQCFRLQPSLIDEYVDTHLLYGIRYYRCEALCLPGLTSVLHAAQLTRSQKAGILDTIPANKRMTVITTEPLAEASLLGNCSHFFGLQYWLRLQKVLSLKLRKTLSTHRRLLLDKVGSESTTEVVLDSFEPKDKLDLYIKNMYGCIDEYDTADLPVLLEFTAQCVELPLLKLAAIVFNIARWMLDLPQLQQAYYRIVHRLAVTVCNLRLFPSIINHGSASFKGVSLPPSSTADPLDCIHSNTVNVMLEYLGFTTDVIVGNFLARRPLDSLGAEAYDGIKVDTLYPLASELELDVATSSSSSTEPHAPRLTAAARAVRIDLFRRFVAIWERWLRGSSDLDSIIRSSHFSTSFKLLSLIISIAYNLNKITSLPPPSLRNEYILPVHISSRLSDQLTSFLQGTYISVRFHNSNDRSVSSTESLRQAVTQELSGTYLKVAIGVRVVGEGDDLCVLLTKLYSVLTSEYSKQAAYIHQTLTNYAKTKLKGPLSTKDLARRGQLEAVAEMSLAEFTAVIATTVRRTEGKEPCRAAPLTSAVISTPMQASNSQSIASQVGRKHAIVLLTDLDDSDSDKQIIEKNCPQMPSPPPKKRPPQQYLGNLNTTKVLSESDSDLSGPTAPPEVASAAAGNDK